MRRHHHACLSSYDRRRRRRSIIKRDGLNCFYCGLPMTTDPGDNQYCTLERLVAGGPYTIENCVLAHWKCNNAAGNLPANVKIAKRHTRGSIGYVYYGSANE